MVPGSALGQYPFIFYTPELVGSTPRKLSCHRLRGVAEQNSFFCLHKGRARAFLCS